MKRTFMQAYVKNSVEAVNAYQAAFEATLTYHVLNEDGTYYHAELDIFSQTLALSETREEQPISGNTMQFCFHFDKDDIEKVQRAFDTLKNGANILTPMTATDYSSCLVDFIDQFGIRWCLFV